METVNKTWIVLATQKRDSEIEFVLTYNPDNNLTPFAYHTRRIDTPKSIFWGHYFSNIIDAVSDWKKYCFSIQICKECHATHDGSENCNSCKLV